MRLALVPAAAIAGLAFVAWITWAATSASQPPGAVPDRMVHAVVLVDVIPSDQAEGLALLNGYVGAARQDANVASMTLIRQDAIPNHFILEEAFASVAAYERFVAEDRVRAFRAMLFPHLGSPWDERRGAALAP